MTRLYKRSVELVIARAVADQFFRTIDETTVRDLRVAFSIERDLSAEPNQATITVYNLAERTREELKAKPVEIRLAAGYDGQLATLFRGDLTWAETRNDGPDVVTRLQVRDGERAVKQAHTRKSYRAGSTDVRAVLADTAKSMGLELPTNIDQANAIRTKLASGLTLDGPSFGEMEKILKPHGFSPSIQNGELQILADDEALAGEAVVVSAETGMIGSPEFGPPGKAGEPPVLSGEMLLHPGLRPGGTILVRSRRIEGLFRVRKVRHTGDTHGGGWISDFEAVPR